MKPPPRCLFSPFALLWLSLVLLLGACSGPLAIKFGDLVLYSPNPRSLLADPALQACLNQALSTVENATPATLKTLACTNSGVENLEGIKALTQLEELELSGNRISDIAPLVNLKNLRVLNLSDNRVGNIGILDSLPILRFVTLSGNDSLACIQVDALQRRLGNTLVRPGQCI
ncbi:MAG: leucine-rich repeat domain-containing protein [Pseudomonadales bacterium]|jgi:hypothetical protein|nr:leucine-rich repeat domain-containing protein [Pseudomonadales bacterium]